MRQDGEWPDRGQQHDMLVRDWRLLSVRYPPAYYQRVAMTAEHFEFERWEVVLDVGPSGGELLLRRRDVLAHCIVPFDLEPDLVVLSAYSHRFGFAPSWTYVALPWEEDLARWPDLFDRDRKQPHFPEYLRVCSNGAVVRTIRGSQSVASLGTPLPKKTE